VSVVNASDEGRDDAVRRAHFGRRLALLVCLALFGLTTTYAFAGGPMALAGTPAVPNPDPPPSPIRHPQPAPPPPPPSVQTYQPTPPPPPAQRKRAPKRTVVPEHPRRQRKPAVVAKATPVLRSERQHLSETLRPPVRVAAAKSISLPSALRFLLGLTVGVSLLVAALALAPRRALPRPIVGVVAGQRERMFLVAVALDAAAGLVLFVFVLAGL